MTRKTLRERLSAEEGVGLIEIVVAMTLLAIIAISFLPVLIQGLKLSANNATRATAVQLANNQMETARSQGEDCSTITDLGPVAVPTTTDPRGVALAVTRTIGACPATYPGVVQFSVRVVRQDTNRELATATTLVYVAQF